MENQIIQYLLMFEFILFLVTVIMHLTKSNSALVFSYMCQSIAASLILFLTSLFEKNSVFIVGAMITFALKAVVAPLFFYRLIRTHALRFSGTTHLNLSLSMLVILILIGLSETPIFEPLKLLLPRADRFLLISLSTIFISAFLIVNRRGAFSQIIGILSLENAIVTFGSLIGMNHSFGLELGVAFDLFAWIVITFIMITLTYRNFGNFDVGEFKSLKE